MGVLDRKILISILVCVIIRIIFLFLPSYESDELAFRFWSQRLMTVGFTNFYSKSIFTNNPIGIFYFFYILSLIKIYFFPTIAFISFAFDIFLKIPANIADILTGILLINFLPQVSSKEKIWIFLLYVLNPFAIFVSSIWGQYDGLSTFFILLTSFYLIKKANPYLSSVLFVCALTIKPQSIMYLPILLLTFIYRFNFKQILLSILVSILALVLIYFPFFPKNPIQGLLTVNFGSVNLFNCTTCFSFNFWGIFGNWMNDGETVYSIPKFYWGFILYILALVPMFSFKSLKSKFLTPKTFLASSVIILSFFMLQSRMHERYIYPFFPFLLLAFYYLKSKLILLFYIIFSLLSFLNLYFAYAYNSNSVRNTHLPIYILEHYFSYFSLIYVVAFLIFYIYSLKILNDKT